MKSGNNQTEKKIITTVTLISFVQVKKHVIMIRKLLSQKTYVTNPLMLYSLYFIESWPVFFHLYHEQNQVRVH